MTRLTSRLNEYSIMLNSGENVHPDTCLSADRAIGNAIPHFAGQAAREV